MGHYIFEKEIIFSYQELKMCTAETSETVDNTIGTSSRNLNNIMDP